MRNTKEATYNTSHSRVQEAQLERPRTPDENVEGVQPTEPSLYVSTSLFHLTNGLLSTFRNCKSHVTSILPLSKVS
jgi:hypothetical protein